MKYTLRFAFVLIAAVIVFPVPIWAESVFVKDGSIVEGTVDSENDKRVVVKLSDNTKKEIKRADIIRIAYGDEYKTKSFIYKKDDTLLEGYIVDENRETYTVRTNITSIVEIQIPRKSVRAIADERIKEKAATPVESPYNFRYYAKGIVPGWAQISSGNPVKGGIFLTSFAGSLGFYVYSQINYKNKQNAYNAATTDFDAKYSAYQSSANMLNISGLVVAGVCLVNWADVIFFNSFPVVTSTAMAPSAGLHLAAFSTDDSTPFRKGTGAVLALDYRF